MDSNDTNDFARWRRSFYGARAPFKARMKKRMLHESAKRGIIFMIAVYQQSLSIFFGPCCRFDPSCSSYASLSIQRFGIVIGGWLSLKRLFRCHPFHPGGHDPVPDINQYH